ncbi:concanavalin A-like lectin/glucanase superfamily protein [Couchioplanes caeruleus]|uniref:Ricin B lectin domain-containing protein n=2 Tax=Couchioplanes caeruleus TaxID=56438 RepID=A0A1K0GR01_9ACTN|nr:ricin-type beta-trefoil lectin domain protein [Couchioplanes caeruleus]OJF14830.1 hypothetical protein BG844_07745 [Couchioplanes caeruleus subsp. caeruleus]ROP30423.1 concanavalin A-like lectin/glucanase superfamily protein [Couchioplanes caeruleus]
MPSPDGIQGNPEGGDVKFRNIRVRVDRAATRYGSITGNGLCFDVINAGKVAGTQLKAITCKADPAQKFTLPGDGTLRIFGLCVDVLGAQRTSTTRFLQLAVCNNTAAQQFVPRTDGTLFNPGQGTCIDDPLNDTDPLYSGTCHGRSNQQWAMPDPRARFGAVIGREGKCLDVVNATAAPGAAVQSIACKAHGAQQITLPGDGTLRVFGLCLDTNGPIRTGTIRWAQTQTCNGGATQQWVQRSDGTLFAPNIGMCLDEHLTEFRLFTGTCHGRSNQQWAIPASGVEGTVVVNTAAHLVSAWSADENAGTTLRDSTGNARTATLKGGTAWTTGRSGSAVSFNGTTGEANTAFTALQTDRSYSVSAWVKASKTAGFPAAVSQEGSQRSAFMLRAAPDPEQWEFTVSTNSGGGEHTRVGSGAGTVTLERWTHLVGVYDATAGKAYCTSTASSRAARPCRSCGTPADQSLWAESAGTTRTPTSGRERSATYASTKEC